jgi:acetoacetate decarboxylase
MNAENQGSAQIAYMFSNAKLLSADVRINAETSAYLLPKPLAFSNPATATIFVADYPSTSFGSVYREAAVFLHVEDEKGPAIFCSWIVVDDDTALIGGRELLGTPKKMAEVTLVEDGNKVTGSVVRKDIEVLRLETTLGASTENPSSFASCRMVNAISTPITGMKLYDMPPAGERIHKARQAPGTITVNPSVRDPLNLMEPVPEIDAQYLLLDFGAPKSPEEMGTLTTDIDGDWFAANYLGRQT